MKIKRRKRNKPEEHLVLSKVIEIKEKASLSNTCPKVELCEEGKLTFEEMEDFRRMVDLNYT